MPEARPAAVFPAVPRRIDVRVSGVMPIHHAGRLRREEADRQRADGRGQMTETTVGAHEQVAFPEQRGDEPERFFQDPMLTEA